MNPETLIKLKIACDGLTRGLTGVDYCRFREWPVAGRLLQAKNHQKILDVGSGDSSFFPLLLALNMNLEMTVLDYSDSMEILKARFDTLLRKDLSKVKPQFVNGDIRSLNFSENYFDRISCVSTIEHIPDDGDILGIKELSRVLKPGGRLVVTVPMTNLARDEFKMNHSYERQSSGQPVFFQRLYDFNTLDQRLIKSSGLKCIQECYLIEPHCAYFWKQDCARKMIQGKMILENSHIHSRLSRSLHYFRSKFYIREVTQSEAKKHAEQLIVGAIVLEKAL